MSVLPEWPTAETKAMWTEFIQSFAPPENCTWADRRYWANVSWLGVPPPLGRSATGPVADGAPLGKIQAARNQAPAGLVRVQVAQDVNRIDISHLGPADLSAA